MERFSSKSYRKVLATKNKLAGVQIEETCRLGGWKGQRTVNGVYDHSEGVVVSNGRREEGVSEGATSNGARASLDQVATMLPAEDRSVMRAEERKRVGQLQNK